MHCDLVSSLLVPVFDTALLISCWMSCLRAWLKRWGKSVMGVWTNCLVVSLLDHQNS